MSEPEEELPPAPAQEAPRQATQEDPLKKDFGEGGLEAAEKALELAGMEKVNEMGKNLSQRAEASTQEFSQETKSLWGRVKERLFKKKDGGAQETPPSASKGEAEILREIEKSDAVFREFRKKAAEIMISGDEDGLRMLERSLSKTYDELAPQVAAEGAAEAAAMKKALKTGEMPQITETGARLNYVAKRLADVRGRLSGEAAPAVEQTQAEKNLDEAFARGIAEYEAEQGIGSKPEPVPTPEAAASAEPEAEARQVEESQIVSEEPADAAVERRNTALWERARSELVMGARADEEVKDMSHRLQSLLDSAPIEVSHDGAKTTSESDEIMDAARNLETSRKAWRAAEGELKKLKREDTSPDATAAATRYLEAVSDLKAALRDAEAFEQEMRSQQEDRKEAEEASALSVEPGPSSETMSKAEAVPAAAPEKKSSSFDTLDASMNDIAQGLIASTDSPKTLAGKIAKMSAEEYLSPFLQSGKLSEAEGKALREEFKLDSEGFNDLRKKLVAAVKKGVRK